MKSNLKNNRYSLCINLLNSFTEKEIEALTQLVSCRYFNTDKQVHKLLEALKKHIIGKCEINNENKLLIYNLVFKNTVKSNLNKAQQGRLYAKLNLLTRISEEFLIIKGLRKDLNYRSDLLAQELLNKNQYWLFERHLKKVSNSIRIEKATVKNYDLTYKLANNKLNKLHKTGDIYHKENNLNEVILNLDLNYLITKLGYQITALSIKRINKKDFDQSVFDVLKNFVSLKQYANNPIIVAQLATIDLLINQNENSFNILLNILDKKRNYLAKDVLQISYGALINFCTQQIYVGKFGYSILTKLYNKMHIEGLLIEGNFISENTLKNIVTIACRAEKLNWAKQMNKHYLPFIRKNIRNSVNHFNIGKIEFYLKNYNIAINHFIKVSHINLTYDINCRVLILRSHYELDQEYDERTVTIFRSAEKFFAEHKTLPKNHKRGYKNFVHILTNLYRRKHRASKMSLERIKASIEKSKVNIDKAWLNEKINELE